MKDFGYTIMLSMINMILMAYGSGRTASDCWENNCAIDEYRHITTFVPDVTYI
jgi:hypothetical protein